MNALLAVFWACALVSALLMGCIFLVSSLLAFTGHLVWRLWRR